MTTGRRKEGEGVVVSDKMDKTVVVVVSRVVRHGKYRKYLRQRARYQAHDEKNQCRVGDRVRIIESRPLSRDKRWVVESVVKREIRTADTGVADLKVEEIDHDSA